MPSRLAAMTPREIRLPSLNPNIHGSRKVDHAERGDIGDRESVACDEFAILELLVQPRDSIDRREFLNFTELRYPMPASFRDLAQMRPHVPDRREDFELDSPVPHLN